MMNDYHISVLLQEAVTNLNIKEGEKYIDATLGGGGHTIEIAKMGGNVLSLDVDEDAIQYVTDRIKNLELRIKNNITLARGNFEHIERIAKDNGFTKVAGILFDLGVSSHQLATTERGFSFQSDAPLDMRMDKTLGVTAADLVNSLSKKELYELFTKFGEETFAWKIAERIIKKREEQPIRTTKELALIAMECYPRGFHAIHPATKIFQALRMAVNSEVYVLEEALPKTITLLKAQGRIVIISFHSLEDRIVKNIFQEWEEKGLGTSIYKKPVMAADTEIQVNNRSRSAKMRVFEKN